MAEYKGSHIHCASHGFNKINGTYCANNSELCTDLLRGEWGFDGIVMTDWLSTGEDRADEATAIEAGLDLIMPGGKKTLAALNNQYQAGKLSRDAIQCACMRVLRLTLYFG